MDTVATTPFQDFRRKRDYLVCIDSDGCAMDTMDIKHHRCFGPCMIKEWELSEWKDEILDRWNQVNLYSMTRGINRFKGLALLLSEINNKYKEIPGIETLIHWTKESDELSNAALDAAFKAAVSEVSEKTNPICLKKALHWSTEVNREIEQLPDALKLPFQGVADGIAFAHTYADVAIVSSANPDAVAAEWNTHRLMGHVDIMLAQDAGSKAYCIEKLLTYGYPKENVLMIGDAPGDEKAAHSNQVHFYPILVSHEQESWSQVNESIIRLTEGTFDETYQTQLIQLFESNLNA